MKTLLPEGNPRGDRSALLIRSNTAPLVAAKLGKPSRWL